MRLVAAEELWVYRMSTRRCRIAGGGERPGDRPHGTGQNDRLRHLLRQLQRMQFGRRPEKLDPDEFNLGLEDLVQAIAAGEAEQEKADPALRQARSEKRRAGRGPLPEHLPRVEIVIEPEDTACPCRPASLWRRAWEIIARRLEPASAEPRRRRDLPGLVCYHGSINRSVRPGKCPSIRPPGRLNCPPVTSFLTRADLSISAACN